jgi:peroxiredoxin Q/BCP
MGTNAAEGNVQVGDLAPDFALPAQDGKTVSLKDFHNKKAVVLYFYPKDDTPGCTREACAFRDSYEDFKDAGAEVIGVSSDSPESHQQFIAKYHLPFTLLSDNDAALRRAYGVQSVSTEQYGVLPGRVTYVIDKEGVVRHVFSSLFEAERHITEAINTLKASN